MKIFNESRARDSRIGGGTAIITDKDSSTAAQSKMSAIAYGKAETIETAKILPEVEFKYDTP